MEIQAACYLHEVLALPPLANRRLVLRETYNDNQTL